MKKSPYDDFFKFIYNHHFPPMLYYFCVMVCLTISEIVTLIYFDYQVKWLIILVQFVVIIEYFALLKRRLEYMLGVDYIGDKVKELIQKIWRRNT